MSLASAFKRCLETLDVVGIRKLWAVVSPNAKRLREDEAEIALHMARTASESLSDAMRLYSHAFLTERGLPSLPATGQRARVLRSSSARALRRLSRQLRPRAARLSSARSNLRALRPSLGRVPRARPWASVNRRRLLTGLQVALLRRLAWVRPPSRLWALHRLRAAMCSSAAWCSTALRYRLG
jgi:hypothetical protein